MAVSARDALLGLSRPRGIRRGASRWASSLYYPSGYSSCSCSEPLLGAGSLDPYRLDEVAHVWRRLSDEARGNVVPADIPYRLAALGVVAKRARTTEAKLSAYIAEHEWAADIQEMREVARRLANIRYAAQAAHGALAVRVSRYVPHLASADAHGSAFDWRADAWLELRGWSAGSTPRTDGPD
jgi:hypothetical protein